MSTLHELEKHRRELSDRVDDKAQQAKTVRNKQPLYKFIHRRLTNSQQLNNELMKQIDDEGR